jgi:hypothetical protein
MMFYFYIPEGICFAVFDAFSRTDNSTKPTNNKKRQAGKHAHKNQKITKKQPKTQVETCKKRQQKQRSRFLQEYKSKTSHT